MIKNIWIIAILMSAMSVLADHPNLESLRSTCSTAMDKISTDTQIQKDAAFVLYGKTLDSRLQDLKRRGDIDGYTVVEQELKRFQNDQTILTNASNVYVSKAVAIYQKQMTAIEIDAESRTANLLRQYIAALGQLVKDLMVEGKIDDAKEVGSVKRNAEFALADAEAKLPKVAKTNVVRVETKPGIVGRWTYSLNKGGFSVQVHAKPEGSVVWEGYKGTKYWAPLGTNAYLISDVKGIQGNKGWVIVHLPIVDGVAKCDDWYAGVNTCILRQTDIKR